MRKISLMLLLGVLLLNCQPEEEEEFTDLDLSVKTEIQGSKKNKEANRIRVKNIEALRKLPFPNTNNHKEVHLLGYYEPHDGGGGNFYWDPISEEEDNGGTIISFQNNLTGRWKREFTDTINVKWFGARGDGVNDDYLAFKAAFNLNQEIFIPKTSNNYIIREGLILKSNISSNGAVLFSDTPGITLINIKKNNVIIDGIHLKGYDTIIGYERYFPEVTIGVSIKGYDHFILRNSEISGWSLAGISIRNSKNNIIEYNYIHHNKRKGLGYGIVLYCNTNFLTNAKITQNYFEQNRHDIAGSGTEGQSYEASYNIIGEGGGIGRYQHRFDMHGKNGDSEEVAGTKILINHNVFLGQEGWAVMIRGIPEETALINDNIFKYHDKERIIHQRILGKYIPHNELINIEVFNNKMDLSDHQINDILKKNFLNNPYWDIIENKI